MTVNVDAPATEKSASPRCTYHDHFGPEEDGRSCHDYPCPFCDDWVGFEPIAGTEDHFRRIPLDDAEIEEVAVGLYWLDHVVADRPGALHNENDYGLLYEDDPSVQAAYKRWARNLVNDDFVQPRQLLAFTRWVGGLGI